MTEEEHNDFEFNAEPKFRKLACKQLYDNFMPLIRKHAGKNLWLAKGGCELDDLVNIGAEALFKAFSKFDHTKGISFTHFANEWIQKEIFSFAQRQGELVHKTGYVRKLLHRIETCEDQLEASLGRPPTDAEIAAKSKIKIDLIKELRPLPSSWKIVSLDEPIAVETGDELTIDETISAHEEDQPENLAQASDRARSIRAALSTLGKHGIAVLKDNAEQIMRVTKDVIREEAPAAKFERNGAAIDCWDFTRHWLLVQQDIRVVATREQPPPLRSQQTGKKEDRPASSWSWITTIPAGEASSEKIVDIARSRWSIENEGFNELSNHWHADHVYRHAPIAITNFWLLSLLAYDLFRAFFNRNLKAGIRHGKTMLHFARLVTSEAYALPLPTGVPP